MRGFAWKSWKNPRTSLEKLLKRNWKLILGFWGGGNIEWNWEGSLHLTCAVLNQKHLCKLPYTVCKYNPQFYFQFLPTPALLLQSPPPHWTQGQYHLNKLIINMKLILIFDVWWDGKGSVSFAFSSVNISLKKWLSRL